MQPSATTALYMSSASNSLNTSAISGGNTSAPPSSVHHFPSGPSASIHPHSLIPPGLGYAFPTALQLSYPTSNVNADRERLNASAALATATQMQAVNSLIPSLPLSSSLASNAAAQAWQLQHQIQLQQLYAQLAIQQMQLEAQLAQSASLAGFSGATLNPAQAVAAAGYLQSLQQPGWPAAAAMGLPSVSSPPLNPAASALSLSSLLAAQSPQFQHAQMSHHSALGFPVVSATLTAPSPIASLSQRAHPLVYPTSNTPSSASSVDTSHNSSNTNSLKRSNKRLEPTGDDSPNPALQRSGRQSPPKRPNVQSPSANSQSSSQPKESKSQAEPAPDPVDNSTTKRKYRRNRETKSFLSPIVCGLPTNGPHAATSNPSPLMIDSKFFGRKIEVFWAVEDPKRQILYSSASLSRHLGCSNNLLAMYLKRRRDKKHRAIFQATHIVPVTADQIQLLNASSQDSETRLVFSAPKSSRGAYFLSLEECIEFQNHLSRQEQRRLRPEADLGLPNSGSRESMASSNSQSARSSSGAGVMAAASSSGVPKGSSSSRARGSPASSSEHGDSGESGVDGTDEE